MKIRLPFDLIVIDLEANTPSGNLIEIGAVKLLRDGGIHPDTFQSFIRIDEELSPYIIQLTGITENDIGSVPYFDAVIAQFEKWATTETKNIILASWGNWDIATLRAAYEQCSRKYPFRGKTLDIKSIIFWMGLITGKKKYDGGLTTTMKQWGLDFEGDKHRAMHDARNTALLLQKVWKFWEDGGQRLSALLGKLGLSE